jgi:hypothetical protein
MSGKAFEPRLVELFLREVAPDAGAV